jgi:2-hydroxy-3-keto-5-methylthiopentenyl-1-phosphate phosphatase
MGSPWVLLSDFDGTITEADASQLILRQYADGEWERYEKMLHRSEITFEGCISSQFRLIRASESDILNGYERFVAQRRGFGALVEFAGARQIPMTIVSGGLKFVINEFLNRNGWSYRISLHVGDIELKEGHMEITFPPLMEEGSSCFKDDLVIRLKRQGIRVIYIGDGSYDFAAARASDIAYAVKGSKLALLCQKHGVAFTEFQDFHEVVESLTRALGRSA